MDWLLSSKNSEESTHADFEDLLLKTSGNSKLGALSQAKVLQHTINDALKNNLNASADLLIEKNDDKLDAEINKLREKYG